MRVVIAASTGFHVKQLAVELASLGHEVEFHSYLPRWKTRPIDAAGGRSISHFLALMPWSGLALLRAFSRGLLPVREGLFARIDRRIAATMRPADVFIGLSGIAVSSARQAREAGALVLIERGSSHILRQQQIGIAEGAHVPSEITVSRELASYALADRIVVLSEFAARTFRERGVPAGTLAVQPLGTDLAQFKPPVRPPPLPVSAIYVGNWSIRKGCDLLAPLLEAHPGLRLTHVGTPGDAAFPASPRFATLGYMDHGGLAAELQRHHLLLFPSRDDGFGMVMAEALASGLRVVASDASGGPDLAALVGPDYVSVFPAGEFDGISALVARQIVAISEQPAQLAAPTERIVELSWQCYGRRYAAMLDKLLDERS